MQDTSFSYSHQHIHYHYWNRLVTTAAPEVNPSAWFSANVACLLASLALLLDLWIAKDHDLSERPAAKAAYLIWNFATTLVWCVEITLSVSYVLLLTVRESTSSTSSHCSHFNAIPWDKRLELLLAIYFTADSLHLVWKWKIKKQHLGAELGDVCINLFSYLYASYETYCTSTPRQATQEQQQQKQQSDSVVNESTGLIA